MNKKQEDIEEKMDLDYGQIYISIKDSVLKIEFDGGDGGSELSQEQISRLREILNLTK